MPPEQAEVNNHDAPVRFRAGTAADLIATCDVLLDALDDLKLRIGLQDKADVFTPEMRAAELQHWAPLLQHLIATADQYWIAERDGKVIGYSRSVLRDDVRELTEFFVSPTAQAAGIGRELLARAMPAGARRNYIMATIDLRAQALYHKLGLYQLCAVYTFLKPTKEFNPTHTRPSSELIVERLTPQHIPYLAQLDQRIHGHRRDVDHEWLIAQRAGFLLWRHQVAVGYGYVGEPFSGPFVMLDAADYPAALAYGEDIAVEQGYETLGLDVPMLNRAAVHYLLTHGYRMSPFFCFYMCDGKPAHVDHTILTGPMIMV
jgi:GNAT superfamily N-acetyltransferase